MLRILTMRLFTIGVLIMAFSGGVVQAAGPVANIKTSFKLDPRLTRSMYMGERWVSPPTFTMVEDNSGNLVVEARAQALDTMGMPVDLTPEWTASEPDMVKVEPLTGMQVRIEILKVGNSHLTVRCGDVLKELSIAASRDDGVLQVEISR